MIPECVELLLGLVDCGVVREVIVEEPRSWLSGLLEAGAESCAADLGVTVRAQACSEGNGEPPPVVFCSPRDEAPVLVRLEAAPFGSGDFLKEPYINSVKGWLSPKRGKQDLHDLLRGEAPEIPGRHRKFALGRGNTIR